MHLTFFKSSSKEKVDCAYNIFLSDISSVYGSVSNELVRRKTLKDGSEIWDYLDSSGLSKSVEVKLDQDYLVYIKYIGPRSEVELEDFIKNNIKFSNGVVTLDEEVGGVYSLLLYNTASGKVLAWSSMPPITPWFYANHEDGFCLASRAILASEMTDNTLLNRDFLRQYIVTGYSLNDCSPYENVFINSYGCTVVGRLSLTQTPTHPNPPVQYFWDEDLENASKRGTEQLLRACKAVEGHGVEVYMSGGVDSRMLLSSLSYKAKSIQCSTNSASPGEIEAAKLITEKLGYKHNIVVDNLEATISERIEDYLRKSGGLPNGEAHIMATSFIKSSDYSAVSFGNWPLYKNAYMHGFPKGYDKIQNRVVDKVLSMEASDASKGMTLEFMRNWFGEQSEKAPLELCYLFALKLRSWRWLLAQHTHAWAHGVPFYPFLDESFVRFCSGAALHHRASFKLAFSMISDMKPEIKNVGLFNKRWRFESNGVDPDFKDGYELREPIVSAPDITDDDGYSVKYLNALDMREVYEGVWSLMSSGYIDGLLQNSVVEDFKELSFEKFSAVYPRQHRFWLKLFSLSIFISKSWKN